MHACKHARTHRKRERGREREGKGGQREQWASTGNSFTAFLLTKASKWEQSKNVMYMVSVIFGGPVGAAYAQAINECKVAAFRTKKSSNVIQ